MKRYCKSAAPAEPLFLDFSVCGNGGHLTGELLAGGRNGGFHRPLQTAAAGNLHPGQGDAFDVIGGKDLRQLFRVVRLVQLRAADQADAAADEILVETAVGIGRAVRRDQQIRPVKEGGVDRDKLDLYRPLTKPAYRGNRGGLPFNGRSLPGNGPQGSTRAAGLTGVFLRGQYRRLVIGRSLPLLKGDGVFRAGRQTIPQTVAVILPHEPGLAVYQTDGPLVAGTDAQTAAAAFFLIYFNYPSEHVIRLLSFAVVLIVTVEPG